MQTGTPNLPKCRFDSHLRARPVPAKDGCMVQGLHRGDLCDNTQGHVGPQFYDEYHDRRKLVRRREHSLAIERANDLSTMVCLESHCSDMHRPKGSVGRLGAFCDMSHIGLGPGVQRNLLSQCSCAAIAVRDLFVPTCRNGVQCFMQMCSGRANTSSRRFLTRAPFSHGIVMSPLQTSRTSLHLPRHRWRKRFLD
jgi:hypothetical protein